MMLELMRECRGNMKRGQSNVEYIVLVCAILVSLLLILSFFVVPKNSKVEQLELRAKQAEENTLYVDVEVIYEDFFRGGGRISKFTFKNKNNLECLVFADYRAGGISCNWEKYNK